MILKLNVTHEVTFAVSNISLSHNSQIQRVLSTICLYMNRKVHNYVACNFNCLFENERLLKVTANHVQCKCGNFSETVPDRVVITANLETTNMK